MVQTGSEFLSEMINPKPGLIYKSKVEIAQNNRTIEISATTYFGILLIKSNGFGYFVAQTSEIISLDFP
jgi:hypothetical protein